MQIGEREIEERELALWLARGRAVVGIAAMVAPALVAKVWVGSAGTEVKAMTRVMGVRDLALAVGAITNLKEQNQDAEWLGVGSVADAVDSAVSLLTPGLPKRARLIGLFAGGMSVVGMRFARSFADAREGRTAAG